MRNLPDIELLKAWEAGDRNAGSELVERYYAVVYRFFDNKVGGNNELENLVQHTFLACLEAHARFAQRCSFKTFVLAVARQQLYNHFRTHHRSRTPDFAITSIQEVGTSPSGFVARRNDTRQMSEAMQRVPLESQISLELAYWEGMTGPELAVIFDLPLEIASAQLKRAKVQLREQLSRLREPGPDERDRQELEAWLGGVSHDKRDLPTEV